MSAESPVISKLVAAVAPAPVNPLELEVDLYIVYEAAPVAALQERLIWSEETALALRFVGAVGTVVPPLYRVITELAGTVPVMFPPETLNEAGLVPLLV